MIGIMPLRQAEAVYRVLCLVSCGISGQAGLMSTYIWLRKMRILAVSTVMPAVYCALEAPPDSFVLFIYGLYVCPARRQDILLSRKLNLHLVTQVESYLGFLTCGFNLQCKE